MRGTSSGFCERGSQAFGLRVASAVSHIDPDLELWSASCNSLIVLNLSLCLQSHMSKYADRHAFRLCSCNVLDMTDSVTPQPSRNTSLSKCLYRECVCKKCSRTYCSDLEPACRSGQVERRAIIGRGCGICPPTWSWRPSAELASASLGALSTWCIA